MHHMHEHCWRSNDMQLRPLSSCRPLAAFVTQKDIGHLAKLASTKVEILRNSGRVLCHCCYAACRPLATGKLPTCKQMVQMRR